MLRILTFIAAVATSAVTLAAPNQMLVQGSDQADFGITCKNGEKVLFRVGKENSDPDYQSARNISFTDMGGGKVAISMMRNRSYSNQGIPTTYLTGADENCLLSAIQ